MTGTTSPDALPFPDDYTKPADSPNAFQSLANAVQVALNTKPDTTSTETSYVKGPNGQQVPDWDVANLAGFYWSDVGATNSPDGVTPWQGVVRVSGTGAVHQTVSPATGGIGAAHPGAVVLNRSWLPNVGWSNWSRLNNFHHSWGTTDNMVFADHWNPGQGSLRRFATGMAKDPGSVGGSALDEWRVQCYDVVGAFTWSAIKIPESGVVSMPKGHAVTLQRLAAGEPIPADTVLTVGMLAEILRAGVGPGELNIGPPTEEVD